MHTLSCREKEIAGMCLGAAFVHKLSPNRWRKEPGTKGAEKQPSHKAAVLLLRLDVKGVGGASVVEVVYGSCQ